MIISAALIAMAQMLSPAAQGFVDEATDRLIAGDELPRDFPVRLQALPPDQRLLVLVHLRRAGFLRDVVMPADWVISAPAPVEGADR